MMIIFAENGDIMFVRNVWIYVRHYMAPNPKLHYSQEAMISMELEYLVVL
jgi:hypothetical protein